MVRPTRSRKNLGQGRSNVPSPTSTSDDSDDDVLKKSSLDESFQTDADLVNFLDDDDGCSSSVVSTRAARSGKYSAATLASLSFVLLLLAFVSVGTYYGKGGLGYFRGVLLDMHKNSNGKNILLRYIAHGEIKAREAKLDMEKHEIFSSKKSKHVSNELPPSVLTKSSSSSRGVLKFNLSGKLTNSNRPMMVYLNANPFILDDVEAFETSANKFGFIYGVPETLGQTYWENSSPVPSDTRSIENVIRSVADICDAKNSASNPCSLEQSKVFVVSKPANYGLIAYKLDTSSTGLWEELNIPSKFSTNWEDIMTWLH